MMKQLVTDLLEVAALGILLTGIALWFVATVPTV